MVFMAQNGALPRTPAHFGKMFGTPALSRHGFYSQSDSEGFDVPGVLNTRGGGQCQAVGMDHGQLS